LETSELLKKVRRIEIKTKDLTRQLFSGEYHSAFKGRGMSFSEVRAYQYGDDVRNIDWNVTARTGEPHIKIFEEERELTVMLLVDLSGSAFFGTRKQMKRDMITEIAAVLAFSAIANNDKVGVIFFSDQVEKFIPPKKGKQHILRIIRELLDFKPEGKDTNIGPALEYFNNLIKKQSIAFLISDFFDTDYEKPLQVVARKHDIIGIQLFDRAETELPPARGLLRIKDAETGKQMLIDAASEEAREYYAKEFKAYFESAQQLLRRSGAELITISTEESYVNALRNFFLGRSRKMGA
jgi:uncharacterized protein (DUF58 family)